MVQQQTISDRFSALATLMGVYQRWFTAALRGQMGQGPAPGVPDDFSRWAEGVEFKNINIDGQYQQRCDDLNAQCEALTNAFTGTLDEKAFLGFAEDFQIFMSVMREFCQTIILEQAGFDMLTGLKNNIVLKETLSVEMERLAREGHSFCVGLARIDDFETIEKHASEQQVETLIKTVSGFVRKSLRNYDDAFRVSRNHFVMCLKQSDIRGGQRALERLRDILETADEQYASGDGYAPLSLSCCVAAPLPEDNLDDLMENLFFDLDEQIKDRGAVLTYQELSPLERFVQKNKG